MTEPSLSRPVPGPSRPGRGPAPVHSAGSSAMPTDTTTREDGGTWESPFAGLDELPVAEHVAVFEAEHSRLRRQLGTIDEL